MGKCTIFSGFVKPIENLPLQEILRQIKSEKYKPLVEELRLYLQKGDSVSADLVKKQLPAFTPSATYEGGRKKELLKNYSGFIHLDFDKMSPDRLDQAIQKLSKDPYTYAFFISPSGNGIKVFVKVNTSAVHHEFAYAQLSAYFEKLITYDSDKQCKDITRLCFVSFDPELYLNAASEVFQVVLSPPETNFSSSLSITNLQDSPSDLISLFQKQIEFTNSKSSYQNGNRNNYIYLLASNCNRVGIAETDCIELCCQSFELDQKETAASVKSAYRNHINEFASFAKFAKSAKSINDSSGVSAPIAETAGQSSENLNQEDYLKNTPFIAEKTYQKLPQLFRSGTDAFTDNRERDVFLTGALAILSGCLPKVKGVYAQQTVYPNLFAFIIAHAASGKGALKFAKMLADKHHDLLVRNSKESIKEYEVALSEHKSRERSRKKGEPGEEPPEQPPFKVLYIPANSSYAKILQHLQENNGEGIICETEADTMGNVLKQEWGGYSDMLRKAFHHERMSSSKKTNNEYIEVNEPRLSVALSGTPNQVSSLIASAEDGLFSRFIFYAFKVDQIWRDVSPAANPINLTDHFSQLSQDVIEMINFLNTYPTIIQFSENHWQQLNKTCSGWLNQTVSFTSEDAGSVIKRMGLIIYRIAMIFTAMRKFENGDLQEIQTCNDEDFQAAIELASVFLEHSMLMFHNLPRQQDATVFDKGDNKRKLYEALPHVFRRNMAVDIGKSFGMSERTVDDFLKKLIPNYLSQPAHGQYQKC